MLRQYSRTVAIVLAVTMSLAGVAAAGVALAQSAATAVLNAVLYRPIPAGAAVHVRTLDDSPQHQDLKRRFEAALRDRGYAIDPAPTRLVITVEPRDQIGFWNYQSGALIEAQRGYDRIARKDLDSYMVNLYNSRQGGLINRPDRPSGVNPSRFRLEARLEDRSDGRTLWQGWTSAELTVGDGQSLWTAMAPPLAGAVGRTVREQRVSLR